MSKLDAFLETLNQSEVEKTAQIEKTAEELFIEKLANQNETIEASTTLALIGEEFCKVAEEGSILYACGETLVDASRAMTLGLQKVAAENIEGMIVDMVETQDDLCKVAEVLAEIADELQDEDFTKTASAVVEINNTLFDELNDLASQDESVAEYLGEFHKEAAASGIVDLAGKPLSSPGTAEKVYESVKNASKAAVDGTLNVGGIVGNQIGKTFSAKHMRDFLAAQGEVGGAEKLRRLLTTGKGIGAAAPTVGTAAALLAGGAYAAKKLHDRHKNNKK